MYLKYDKYEHDREKQSQMPYLDNKLGICDYETIHELEYKVSYQKASDMVSTGKFDNSEISFETLSKIHKYLLSDVYPWAGELREVDMWKGSNMFYPSQHLHNGVQEYFNDLKKDGNLKNLTKNEFVELLAYYATELNVLHPFREGNGRAKRIFLNVMCKQAGWEIDFEKIPANLLMTADILAFGDIDADLPPDMSYIKQLYAENIKLAEGSSEREDKDIYSKINNFLWVFDRARAQKWKDMTKDRERGLSNIKSMSTNKAGREQINLLLDRACQGGKSEEVKALSQVLKEDLANFIKEKEQTKMYDILNKRVNESLTKKSPSLYISSVLKSLDGAKLKNRKDVRALFISTRTRSQTFYPRQRSGQMGSSIDYREGEM